MAPTPSPFPSSNVAILPFLSFSLSLSLLYVLGQEPIPTTSTATSRRLFYVFFFHEVDHGPNNYKDTKPSMSSLLAFNIVYRPELQSVILVFSTGFVKHCPSILLPG